jgi:hypothetical protein
MKAFSTVFDFGTIKVLPSLRTTHSSENFGFEAKFVDDGREDELWRF